MRYVSDVKDSEKEVRIFDLNDEKKIFNIFFMELDSAICLNGALSDVVDKLNEQYDKIVKLENMASEDALTMADLIKRNQVISDDFKAYCQKVSESIQKHYDKADTIAENSIIDIADELGIKLNRGD